MESHTKEIWHLPNKKIWNRDPREVKSFYGLLFSGKKALRGKGIGRKGKGTCNNEAWCTPRKASCLSHLLPVTLVWAFVGEAWGLPMG